MWILHTWLCSSFGSIRRVLQFIKERYRKKKKALIHYTLADDSAINISYLNFVFYLLLSRLILFWFFLIGVVITCIIKSVYMLSMCKEVNHTCVLTMRPLLQSTDWLPKHQLLLRIRIVMQKKEQTAISTILICLDKMISMLITGDTTKGSTVFSIHKTQFFIEMFTSISK